MRVVIRGSLASWAAEFQRFFNRSPYQKPPQTLDSEDLFLAQLSISDIRRELIELPAILTHQVRVQTR